MSAPPTLNSILQHNTVNGDVPPDTSPSNGGGILDDIEIGSVFEMALMSEDTANGMCQSPKSSSQLQRQMSTSQSPTLVGLENNTATIVKSKSHKKWESRFRAVFDRSTAADYAMAFARHKISADKPPLLTTEDYREMGIPIGHRKVMNEIIIRVRAASETHVKDSFSFCPGKPSLAHQEELISDLNPICTTRTFKCGLSWKDYEGTCDNLDAFLHFVDTVMLQKGTTEELPSSFQRAFWDNKPMPFAMKAHTKYGRAAVLLLLRLPSYELVADPVNVKDSIMATMTNRFVIMYVPRGMQGGELITYHKDPSDTLPWLEEIKNNIDDYLAQFSRENVILHLLSESMHTTKTVLDAYRSQLETLQDVKVSQSPTAVVEWMNLIGRQAQVLKRCLSRDKDAVGEFSEMISLQATTAIQIVADMTQSAEEIESNAYDAMQLRMGLVGFRSQENMKLFTFISALASPLTVLTGWYGMNFESMTELHDPDAYNIFIAVSGATAVALVVLIHYLHRDSAPGSADPTLLQIVSQDTQHTTISYLRTKRGSTASSDAASDIAGDAMRSPLNESMTSLPDATAPPHFLNVVAERENKK